MWGLVGTQCVLEWEEKSSSDRRRLLLSGIHLILNSHKKQGEEHEAVSVFISSWRTYNVGESDKQTVNSTYMLYLKV